MRSYVLAAVAFTLSAPAMAAPQIPSLPLPGLPLPVPVPSLPLSVPAPVPSILSLPDLPGLGAIEQLPGSLPVIGSIIGGNIPDLPVRRDDISDLISGASASDSSSSDATTATITETSTTSVETSSSTADVVTLIGIKRQVTTATVEPTVGLIINANPRGQVQPSASGNVN